ncbi:MAG: succinate dehydrogenase, hydrophobic membrane anchor protein [Gammaproteobacteria bacterium]
MTLRTPLSRVLGLGSAHDGTSGWWAERMTAVALVPLGLWFAFSLLSLDGLDYADVRDWAASPLNTLLLGVLVVVTFYHSLLGVHVVIEDYVHSRPFAVVSLVLVDFAHVLLGAASLFAVLRVSFGAGP